MMLLPSFFSFNKNRKISLKLMALDFFNLYKSAYTSSIIVITFTIFISPEGTPLKPRFGLFEGERPFESPKKGSVKPPGFTNDQYI